MLLTRAFLLKLIFVVLLTGIKPVLASGDPHGLDDSRVRQIAQMLPQNPAGFGVPCSERSQWGSVSSYYQRDVAAAEDFIQKPLPSWNDDAYLEYSRDGNRTCGERMLQDHTGQLGLLVLAECSEWKGRFLPRIIEQLQAIATDRSWTLPAHDPHLENFYGKRLYVDLRAAILAHQVAEALYLLGDRIPSSTREEVEQALELHVFRPMRGAFALNPADETYISWLTAKHNWNAVCLEGVVDAALTILPDRNDRAVFAAAAEHWGTNYLDSFTDDGYDTEGIGYWSYGFTHFDEMREQLWLSTGGRLDLFDRSKAQKAALFGIQFAMLPGVYADFGDAHFAARPGTGLLASIDRTFGLNVFPDDLIAMRGASSDSLSFAVLAAFPNQSQLGRSGNQENSLVGLRTWYPGPGILVARPGQSGDLAVTIKAGGNGNHSHNDVGSYSIGVGNTQMVGDPGGASYYDANSFGSKRYDSRLLNSFGHPVPTIDGELQKEATTVHPTVLSTKFSSEEDSVSMDISDAYRLPKLKSLVRTLDYIRNQQTIKIVDDFDLTSSADIEESFPTHGECSQVDSRTLEFDFGGSRLSLTIEAPGAIEITKTLVDDYANRFTRVGAHIHLVKSGRIEMTFREIPKDNGRPVSVDENAPDAGDAPKEDGPIARACFKNIFVA